MAENPKIILSGFADETAPNKTPVEQFAAFAALGLEYYTIRFMDAGSGIKNVMKLTKAEIAKIRKLEREYGLNVSSLGSPIGKVKLLDVKDGTSNKYIPFKKYLEKDVRRACDLAHSFETKLIRGFSFYHPKDTNPEDHIAQTVDQLGQIAEACHRSDLTFGLEVEANLVGQTGGLLAQIHRQVNHPAMVLIFDAANVVTQGFSTAETIQQYKEMKRGLGWFHVKDYRNPPKTKRTKHVDEDALKAYVPADMGDGGYVDVFKDFRSMIPKLEKVLRRRGIPGVFVDLEPHVKGGGQFGGFSGPDGMGVALRGLCRVLEYAKIDYDLRNFDDVQAARGY